MARSQQAQFEEEEDGSASAPGLDDTQPVVFKPRTPAQQVLAFLGKADAGESSLDGVPADAKVGNIRVLGILYLENQALASLDVTWTSDGGKTYDGRGELKQIIPIVR
jgi:hypothetical protein